VKLELNEIELNEDGGDTSLVFPEESYVEDFI
jgi:hypothetical protein